MAPHFNLHFVKSLTYLDLTKKNFSDLTMAFALVEWKGDPKPDCWQVIQIQGSRDGIKEGNLVDALWKRDEDTSIAEILKLSGRCKYTVILFK